MGLVGRLLGRASGSRPVRRDPDLALVYRGPASLPGCPEAVAHALHLVGMRVAYVGPRETRRLSPDELATAAVYAQPGGGDLDDAWTHLRSSAGHVRDFVAGGGTYLGFCLGAYLAGDDPGFALVPGQLDQYLVTHRSEVSDESDTVVTVDWAGSPRAMFFQDGPYVDLHGGAEADVVARYANGHVAALVCPFGQGRVGIVGPHPEATRDWFTDAGLTTPAVLAIDLAVDLVERARRTDERDHA